MKNIIDNRRCVLYKELYDQIMLINSLRLCARYLRRRRCCSCYSAVRFSSSFLQLFFFRDLSKMSAMCCTRNAVADCTCASRLLIISFPLPFRRRFESLSVVCIFIVALFDVYAIQCAYECQTRRNSTIANYFI